LRLLRLLLLGGSWNLLPLLLQRLLLRKLLPSCRAATSAAARGLSKGFCCCGWLWRLGSKVAPRGRVQAWEQLAVVSIAG